MNLKMKPSSKQNLFDDDQSSNSDSSSSSSGASKSEKIKNDGARPDNTCTSSSSESETKLTVNKKYAKDYQDRKQREELRQVSQRRRENGLASDEDDDSSSEEEEDEDGKLLTESVNLQFLKTIKALKNKDATIYDPDARFFDGDEDDDGSGKGDEKKRKPKKFKDVLRDQILQDMEKTGSDNVDRDNEETKKTKLEYDEQQEELRKAFLKKTEDQESEEDDEEDWMIMKRKSDDDGKDLGSSEVQEEFKELEHLSGPKVASDISFADPRGEVKDGEQFLIDFMKNKKWKDRQDGSNMDAADDGEKANDDSSIEDLDRADDFEAKYNFRFEQAAAETASSGAALSIQTYARGQTMNTVRRQDVTRKEKRHARKERKEAERKAKEEQLKRLKNAKRQEIEQKLSQIKAVVGSVDEEALDEAAIMKMLEGDYNPEQFEKAMQEAYGDDYYAKEDIEWKNDLDVRKALEGDDDGDGIVGQDDVDGGMYDDENYEGGLEGDEGESGDFGEEDNEEYTAGDVDAGQTELEKNVKTKLQEELYKLDYEDIVAGMPTRFKYRQVEPNDYGLTTQEVLLARDTSLKQFVSLKKMAPYNENGEHLVGSKKRRRFREMLKQDLEEEMGQEDLSTNNELEQENAVEHESQGRKKRRRLKKGKKKSKEDSDKNKHKQGSKEVSRLAESGEPQTEDRQSRKRRKKAKKVEDEPFSKEGVKSTSETSQDKILEPSKATNDRDFNEIHDIKKDKSRRKKKKSKKIVSSIPKSRLASYGL